MIKPPQGIERKMFVATLEPRCGMPQPTGPTVLWATPENLACTTYVASAVDFCSGARTAFGV